MKNNLIYKVLLAAGVSVFALNVYAEGDPSPCTATSTTSCTVTADYSEFVVHKLGLCTAAPTEPAPDVESNYLSACEMVFDSPAGKKIAINTVTNTSTSLTDSIQIANGRYTHAVLLLGTEFATRHQQTFSSEKTAINGGSGTICWTDSVSRNAAATPWTGYSQCGTSLPADFASNNTYVYRDTIKAMSGNEDINWYKASELNPTQVLLNMNSATAVATNIIEIPDSGGSFTSDAQFMLAIITLDSPVTIDETTTNVDVGFPVTDATEVHFNGSTIERIGIAKLGFKVSAQ